MPPVPPLLLEAGDRLTAGRELRKQLAAFSGEPTRPAIPGHSRREVRVLTAQTEPRKTDAEAVLPHAAPTLYAPPAVILYGIRSARLDGDAVGDVVELLASREDAEQFGFVDLNGSRFTPACHRR